MVHVSVAASLSCPCTSLSPVHAPLSPVHAPPSPVHAPPYPCPVSISLFPAPASVFPASVVPAASCGVLTLDPESLSPQPITLLPLELTFPRRASVHAGRQRAPRVADGDGKDALPALRLAGVAADLPGVAAGAPLRRRCKRRRRRVLGRARGCGNDAAAGRGHVPGRTQGHLCIADTLAALAGRPRAPACSIPVRACPHHGQGRTIPIPRLTHQSIAPRLGAPRRVRVCILGSREQMCIHPEVARVETNKARNQLCRQRVAQRSCEYRNHMDRP